MAIHAGKFWHRLLSRWPSSRRPHDIPVEPYYIRAWDRRVSKGWASYGPQTARKRWLRRKPR